MLIPAKQDYLSHYIKTAINCGLPVPQELLVILQNTKLSDEHLEQIFNFLKPFFLSGNKNENFRLQKR